MKTFKYEAMTLNGQRIDGEKSAASIEDLAAALQEEGYYLLSHRELTLLDRVRKKCFADEEALIFFLRQLAFMLQSGISISRTLTYLQEDAPKRYIRMICEDLQKGLSKGKPLQAAWRDSALGLPAEIGDWFEIGDMMGDLSSAAQTAADELAERRHLKQSVAQQVFYPVLVLCLLLLFFNLLLFVILPTLMQTYAQLGVRLPVMMQPLAALSKLFAVPGLSFILVPLGPALFIALGIWVNLYPPARHRLWQLARRLPPVRRLLYRHLYVAFAGSLGRLLSAGVGLERALVFLQKRQFMASVGEDLGALTLALHRGMPLSRAMENLDFVPELAATLLFAGEQAGNLPQALLDTAGYYRERAEMEQRFLLRIIEPVAVVFLGAMVLAVALMFFLPLLGTYDQFLQ